MVPGAGRFKVANPTGWWLASFEARFSADPLCLQPQCGNGGVRQPPARCRWVRWRDGRGARMRGMFALEPFGVRRTPSSQAHKPWTAGACDRPNGQA